MADPTIPVTHGPLPDAPSPRGEGWVRRHLADAARAREAVDLYRSLGFEVQVRSLDAGDFAQACQDCARDGCAACVLIYTRPRPRTGAAAPDTGAGASTQDLSMDPTRSLRDEHRLILDVLECFEASLERARGIGPGELDRFAPFVIFFREFADRCHHRKEEEVLFPAMERAGTPVEGGPIGMMLEEHDIGRAHLAALTEAIAGHGAESPAALRALLASGEAYAALLRDHIAKEDQVLFAMASETFRGAEADRLARDLAAVEDAEALARGRAVAAELMRRDGSS